MTLDDLGILEAPLRTLSVLFLVLFTMVALLAAVFWLLRALGIYEMERRYHSERAWYAFVPFFYSCAVGRLAGRYRNKKGKTSDSAKTVLPLLSVLIALLVFVSLGMLGSASVGLLFALDRASAAGTALTADAFRPLLPAFAPLGLAGLLALVYRIVYLVCFYRIAVLFDSLHAGVQTVLGLFFPFLIPIFLFSMRNRIPIEQDGSTGFSGFEIT